MAKLEVLGRASELQRRLAAVHERELMSKATRDIEATVASNKVRIHHVQQFVDANMDVDLMDIRRKQDQLCVMLEQFQRDLDATISDDQVSTRLQNLKKNVMGQVQPTLQKLTEDTQEVWGHIERIEEAIIESKETRALANVEPSMGRNRCSKTVDCSNQAHTCRLHTHVVRRDELMSMMQEKVDKTTLDMLFSEVSATVSSLESLRDHLVCLENWKEGEHTKHKEQQSLHASHDHMRQLQLLTTESQSYPLLRTLTGFSLGERQSGSSGVQARCVSALHGAPVPLHPYTNATASGSSVRNSSTLQNLSQLPQLHAATKVASTAMSQVRTTSLSDTSFSDVDWQHNLISGKNGASQESEVQTGAGRQSACTVAERGIPALRIPALSKASLVESSVVSGTHLSRQRRCLSCDQQLQSLSRD